MDRQHKPSRLARLIPTRRRLIQLYAALLYNAHLKGFIQGDIYTGPLKALCVPGFNCYSCPGAIGACPLGALQNALASSGNRGPWYVLGILMVLGLSLGRVICGWLCPLGLIQEWVHKLPTPKLGKGRFTRALSWLKYVILALFVVALPLAYALARFPLPAFCKYICPAGTLEGAIGLLSNPVNGDKFSMLGILFTRKFIILVVITIRVFTLDGIWEGMNFYLAPDLDALMNPDMWMAAAGMALFAVGLGPGYLVTYGSYASDKADVATDFVTLNVTQLLLCVLCGFVTIPAVVMFGLDPTAGKGLIFQSLPLVFSEMAGGLIWFLLFMICMFFAGFSSTLGMLEIPVASLQDGLKWSRKKSIWVVTIIACIGAIPCVWSDAFFAFFDNLIGNVFY